MTEQIKIALIKRKMSTTELAKKLNCTPQNITAKFKRDNFSEKELQEIAKALDCTYKASFIMNDTGEEI
ncbi:MAG: helix-turn-helix transcriptional regulator [Lachnospiraceae bacterium]|nr:helix-turn-helix transcriptional regulator [Lachnospiraceae bacterium]